MRKQDLWKLAVDAYWATGAVGGTHQDCAQAVREAIAPYGGYIVDGHPVPYSLTVYVRGRDALEDVSLGYIGSGIRGGAEQRC